MHDGVATACQCPQATSGALPEMTSFGNGVLPRSRTIRSGHRAGWTQSTSYNDPGGSVEGSTVKTRESVHPIIDDRCFE